MKVILTGSTGFIGSEVLLQALQHPSITSIVTLTRRPLDSSMTSHPSAAGKLHPIIMEDFLIYPATVVEQLQGATACIWCQGALSGGDRTSDVDYTLTAARKFLSEIQRTEGTPFRFVYLSGMLVERNQNAKLWFLSEVRKMRGEVEVELLQMRERNAKTWDVVIAKPGFVERSSNPLPRGLDAYMRSIRVDEVAAALVEAATEGSTRVTLDNQEVRARGARVLERMRKATS
ncbi:MAG: hypothetical protein M1828_002751 [Chrysothrix sp. TS-e1954]|nr:MAG: hypothetical protein M1828_002751 [Chrysothrix sp. TS-e1954]